MEKIYRRDNLVLGVRPKKKNEKNVCGRWCMCDGRAAGRSLFRFVKED